MPEDNDNENEDEPIITPFYVGDLSEAPEPLRRVIQSMRDRAEQEEMSVTADQHDWYTFIRERTEGELKMLYRFINIIGGNGEVSSYHLGYINSVMEMKFGLCPGCHEKHDEDLAKIVSPDT